MVIFSVMLKIARCVFKVPFITGGGFHDIRSSPKRPPIIDPLLTSKDQPALTEIPSPEFPLREFQNG